MTFKHLLVPLDGSELASAVLPVARALAAVTGAELTPLTVSTGDPATVIVDVARDSGVDLIVMATHGHSGLRRTLFGSVADRVVRASPVAMLVLHPDQPRQERLRTFVVPVDGTPGGAVALATAVPLARQSGARLIVLRASVPLPLWVYEPTLGLDTGPLIDPMWDEDARRAAEIYAEGVAERIRRDGVAAEGRGVSGQPGAAIVSLADEVDADLIVMSTHARAGAVRSVLGSVADEVVRESHRPVLLVRRAATPPGPEAEDASRSYELLADPFSETEAGLPPHG